MRRTHFLSLVAAVVFGTTACADAVVEPTTELDAPLTVAPTALAAKISVSGTYILSAARGRFNEVKAAVIDAGGTITRSHPNASIIIAADLSPNAAQSLSRTGGVQAVAANVMIEHPDFAPRAEARPDGDPSDAFFYSLGYQWNMQIIEADAAWDDGANAEGVTVAILDSGIDATHPDLAGLVDASRSVAFVPNANPSIPAWGDDYFHGTHVAGTVTSNGLGVAGVAPGATLISVKVCGAFFGCPFDAIVSGIIWATEHDAEVINMSLGGFVGKAFVGGGQLNALLNSVINYAASEGVTVVSAAGNDGFDLQHLGRNYRAGPFVATPCESGNGMCISATNVLDEPTDYTNFGTSAVSMAAPGGDGLFPVISVCSNQSVYLPQLKEPINCGPTDYIWATGTSMATPHVAGAAALIIATGATKPSQVKTILQRTADDLGKPGTDPFYGKGRLNVFNAWNR